MPTNISKYIQISDFLLLEVEMNRDGVTTPLSSMGSLVAITDIGTKQYFNLNKSYALGVTNNIIELNSVPLNAQRTNWYTRSDDTTQYYNLFDSSILITTSSYKLDTMKLHIVSGYNFDDTAGFLLQIRAKDTSSNLVDLTNFTYAKQNDSRSSDVIKFASNTLFLGNRFYDKYVEFKVPSIQELGGDTTTQLGQTLSISQLSDIYVTYSTIDTISQSQYVLNNVLSTQIPVTSVADNFNAFIAESAAGDFIEYYATWADEIIGTYISDIESGKIRMYTSNNPNDNYQEFSDTYGVDAKKWVIMHEIYVYEQFAGNSGGTSILTQKFAFTQDENFNLPNYFRPVLKNSDIDASYTINYVCRLMNRMDGTQVIRKAAFASTDPKKYGLWFTRLNVDNIIPYNVFNRVAEEKPNIVVGSGRETTKYVKVFFDTATVQLNELNEVFPQGTGPLFFKNGDSIYKLKFEKVNSISRQRTNVDLSGAYNYALMFKLDNKTKFEVLPTYSTNMNTTLGELEFKLTNDQINTLVEQTNNTYSIVVKNLDGTSYTFYEGLYHSYSDKDAVMKQYHENVTESYLMNTIADLEKQVKTLTDENSQLKIR